MLRTIVPSYVSEPPGHFEAKSSILFVSQEVANLQPLSSDTAQLLQCRKADDVIRLDLKQ